MTNAKEGPRYQTLKLEHEKSKWHIAFLKIQGIEVEMYLAPTGLQVHRSAVASKIDPETGQRAGYAIVSNGLLEVETLISNILNTTPRLLGLQPWLDAHKKYQKGVAKMTGVTETKAKKKKENTRANAVYGVPFSSVIRYMSAKGYEKAKIREFFADTGFDVNPVTLNTQYSRGQRLAKDADWDGKSGIPEVSKDILDAIKPYKNKKVSASSKKKATSKKAPSKKAPSKKASAKSTTNKKKAAPKKKTKAPAKRRARMADGAAA